jgi:SPP1 gp7 family putative phage head morphogenesis protein
VGGSASEDLFDAAVRHAVDLERVKKRQVRKLSAKLRRECVPELKRRLVAGLERLKGRGQATLRSKAFRRLKKLIEDGAAAVVKLQKETLLAALQELAELEADWVVATFRRLVPLRIDFKKPSPQLLRSLATTRPFEGELLEDWWKDVGRSMRTRLTRQLRLGLVAGDSTAKIASRFARELGKTVRQAAVITRTAVNHVTTQARESTYTENADLVKGVQIVATLDMRTTEICMAQDGKVYGVAEGPRPPFHQQCRTTTVPVLRSLRELGIKGRSVPESTRASMNGQVPARQTYGTWLRRQPKMDQVEILGPGKAKLFRYGKVTVEQFVDRNLRPLSLRELRASCESAGAGSLMTTTADG